MEELQRNVVERAANYIDSDAQNTALVNKFIAPVMLVRCNWDIFWFRIHSWYISGEQIINMKQ